MSEWKEYRISELGKIGRGKSKHRPRNDKILYGGEYPFIQTGDVKKANFYINKHNESYNEVGLAQSKLWDEGTLCITIAANIADTAILKYPACFPDSIVGFIPYKDISDIRFVKYYFDIYKKHMEAISMGATQNNLSIKKLESLKFIFPNLQTQERIADVLSTYDDLIENNSKRIEILEKTAEEIYKEWFVRMRFPGYEDAKFEKGIPKGWEVVKLEDICTLVRGISYSTKEIEKNKGVAMLTLKSVNAYGGYNYGGLRFFDGNIADRHYLRKNDLVMAITDMTQDRRVIGQVCLIPKTSYKELVFSADLILLGELKVEKGYMYALLRYGGLSQHIAMFANGANVLHLNQRTLNKINFLVAPKLLRKDYDLFYKEIQIEINILEVQNQNLTKQRDLLLPRLMNGTIEVK